MSEQGQHRWEWAKEEAKKVIFRWAVILVGGVFLWLVAPVGDQIKAIYHSPQRLDEISEDVRQLSEEVRRANGEDRVIRQPPGLSYVEEPVTVGQDVTMVLVLERTSLGRPCIFVRGQSLFRDTGGITLPGSIVTPQQQIEDQTRLRVRMTPPDDLEPGRIEVRLVLEYRCGASTLFEPTETVAYKMTE